MIVAANAAAPRELAALFAPYMFLLQLDPVQHASTFAAGAGGAVAPNLEKFDAEVTRLQRAAQEVSMLCSYSVRTGAVGQRQRVYIRVLDTSISSRHRGARKQLGF